MPPPARLLCVICLALCLMPFVPAARANVGDRAADASKEKAQQPPPPPATRPRRQSARPAPVLSRTLGELKKVEAASITVAIQPVRTPAVPRRKEADEAQDKDKEKDKANGEDRSGGRGGKPAAAEERTLTVDEATKVFVGEVAGERQGPRGQPIRTTRFRAGKASDLKAGQRVMLVIGANDHADRVEIMPSDKPADQAGGL